MPAEIYTPTKQELQELIKNEPFLVVDFFATWCSPCKRLSPIIEDLAKKYSCKLKIIKIDIDKSSEIADEYDVQSVPTILLFKNGNLIQREVGFNSLKKYEDVIDKHL